MKTSLLVSTYNRPSALRLCLQSILSQSQLPDEILVADDGSGAPTRAVVVAMQQKSLVPILHVWHEDDGFRLAAIRNKALLRASGDYIIQIDGDMLLHRQFVRDHIRFARQGYWLKGNRVMLPEKLTHTIEHEGARLPGNLLFRSDVGKRKLLLPFDFLNRSLVYRMPFKGVQGGNMSYWKVDAEKVNGFDEAFEGWGKEDDDFVQRLMRTGVRPAQLVFAARTYHLYHPDADRSKVAINTRLLEKRNEAGLIRAGKGLKEASLD